jgi:hypothetical protein
MSPMEFKPTISTDLRRTPRGYWDRHVVSLHSAIIFHSGKNYLRSSCYLYFNRWMRGCVAYILLLGGPDGFI